MIVKEYQITLVVESPTLKIQDIIAISVTQLKQIKNNNNNNNNETHKKWLTFFGGMNSVA